eukprot:g24132.t1
MVIWLCDGRWSTSPYQHIQLSATDTLLQGYLVKLIVLSAIMQVPRGLFSRILYTNPRHSQEPPPLQRSNIMTISWLTPTSNHGNFVASVNATRYSAGLLKLSHRLVLNVPVAGMEQLVLNVGRCSGRDDPRVSKLERLGVETCRPGWRPWIAQEEKQPHKKRRHGKLSKSAKAWQKAIADCDRNNDIALSACVAHLVCVLDKVMDELVDGHLLLVGRIEAAWVKADYWDGTIFCPKDGNPPYLTFFGSQKFAASTTILTVLKESLPFSELLAGVASVRPGRPPNNIT